ncbi:MAG: T9SS type A sorting domain-containing protein [Chitinophagaceae bacterium]
MKNIFKISIPFFIFSFCTLQAFSQAGTLDPTFGSGGIVKAENYFASGNSSVIQSDGKIVVTGNGYGYVILISRFNPDGSNDESFGSDGKMLYNFDDKATEGRCITLQNDGKILVASNYITQTGKDVVIMQCETNGMLDSSFGENGLAFLHVDALNLVAALKVQQDGKILISGDVRSSQFDQKRTFLFRLNTDGSKDETFGDAGIVINNYSNASSNKGLVIRPNGKLIMGVLYNINGSQSTYELQSFNTDGSVDVSYGTDGIAKFIFGEGQGGLWNTDLYAIALQEDGKIVCTGTSGKDNVIAMAVCRFKADGSIDENFGENGGTIIPYYGEPENRDITVQPDGKIITVGDIQEFITEPGKLLLTRLLENGNLDPSFGNNGISATIIDSIDGQVGQNVHLLSENKILVTGTAGPGTHIYLARFNNDPILAANFKEIKAAQNNDAITITWQTLNESGTKSFTVERSGNANNYVGINTVPAKGVASNYSYTDKNPLDGISYYRIRENAANGTNTFSPVVKMVFNSTGVISLYPNPAKNTVTVKGLNKNNTAVIKITDMQGREISSQNFTQSSSAILNIRALAQGTYFVQVAQEGKVVRLKLIKE